MNLTTIVLLAVFAIGAGLVAREGLWNNAINLVNLVTGALLATNYFEPLADWIDGKSTYTYFVDFLSIWALFCVIYSALRAATSALSKVQVRFKPIVNQVGGTILAIWIGWVLVCFTATTMHMAPMGRNYLLGSFQPRPESKLMFGFAPDHKWLAFVQKMSLGGFCTSPPAGVEGKVNAFDPRAEFVLKYAERRAAFERTSGLRVRR